MVQKTLGGPPSFYGSASSKIDSGRKEKLAETPNVFYTQPLAHIMNNVI
jgi:hypothetical protein